MIPLPLLFVEGLAKSFAGPRTGFLRRTSAPAVSAVQDVTFSLQSGEVLGIVGGSGSGKTTVARMLVRLIEPTAGAIALHDRDVLGLPADEVRSWLRPRVRMIFQDPDASLNPAYTVGTGLARALRLHRPGATDAEVRDLVGDLLARVGMDESFSEKYADELSGGEKRRLGLCRALLTNPEVIVADEPLSGLDVVLQERVLQVLKAEQAQRGFAVILVSHDLDRVSQVCDRVLVMYQGRVVEEVDLRGSPGTFGDKLRHPYSMRLHAARMMGKAGRVDQR